MLTREQINAALALGETARKLRPKITARTGRRLRTMALELEQLANRLADEGWADEARDIRSASGRVGNAGREICNRLQDRN
jgi:hypothetical protein